MVKTVKVKMDEDGPFYSCCPHCETEDGEFCHDLDTHTIGCNEETNGVLCVIGNVRIG